MKPLADSNHLQQVLAQIQLNIIRTKDQKMSDHLWYQKSICDGEK